VHVGVIGYPNVGKSSVINLLKGKGAAEKKSMIEKVRRERAGLRKELDDLARKREAFLAKERAKAPKDGFDEKVLEALREQATAAGIAY